ncbi:MAG: hypothetical protein ACT4P7_15465, partial [Gemmatimonadaceae bacterium]
GGRGRRNGVLAGAAVARWVYWGAAPNTSPGLLTGAGGPPPRNELWAPLVGGRDFVRERLGAAALAAQQRLTLSEARVVEAERAFRAGTVSQHALSDAQSAEAQARQEFQVVAQKLMLRDTFLKEGLSPEEVTRRVQRFELLADAQRVQRQLELAMARVTLVRQRSASGAADELDLKRAEVEVLERRVELDRLRRQLREAEKPPARTP